MDLSQLLSKRDEQSSGPTDPLPETPAPYASPPINPSCLLLAEPLRQPSNPCIPSPEQSPKKPSPAALASHTASESRPGVAEPSRTLNLGPDSYQACCNAVCEPCGQQHPSPWPATPGISNGASAAHLPSFGPLRPQTAASGSGPAYRAGKSAPRRRLPSMQELVTSSRLPVGYGELKKRIRMARLQGSPAPASCDASASGQRPHGSTIFEFRFK
ncbi:uncharacterized protein BJ171DRAFT_98897 [Polychytrium aggregatum]|uniref:uncharacterized protein n=1 Tax=Polychytrium aggregatum TaxID=110093 RepID=UPI0022FF440B|nr:uncharacterized protein BJ171DRAFT_98897 [Polychytrium aggregatum]KAI9204629.1 hypothetical protein BJ171DRAFT_98897 [Polychytrium aggregatum]